METCTLEYTARYRTGPGLVDTFSILFEHRRSPRGQQWGQIPFLNLNATIQMQQRLLIPLLALVAHWNALIDNLRELDKENKGSEDQHRMRTI
jgi:hypothetical protein